MVIASGRNNSYQFGPSSAKGQGKVEGGGRRVGEEEKGVEGRGRKEGEGSGWKEEGGKGGRRKEGEESGWEEKGINRGREGVKKIER